MRVFTGKCAISQTGAGTGYWQVNITNFNDPAGQFDATEIVAGDYLYFSDSGNAYELEITQVVSASGSNATIKVSNVGVTGISSVPTTTSSFVSRRTTNFGLFPWVANLPANENQIQVEQLVIKIDDAINNAGGGGGTDLAITGTSSPLTLTSSTGTDVTFIAGSNVTLSGTGSSITINSIPDGQGVTAVTATSPLSSSGGNTPDISLTGIVPVANGGTGSSTQNFWDLTNNQQSLGVKKTSGGLIVGTTDPFTGMGLGTTQQTAFGLKGGTTAFVSEATIQDWFGLVTEVRNPSGSNGTQTVRFSATGSDTNTSGSEYEFRLRAKGASKNLQNALQLKSYETGVSTDLPYAILGNAVGTFADSTYGAALNIPASGIGIEGSVAYLLTTSGGASGENLRLVQKNGATYITTASIDATTNGWNAGSDQKLKHDIEEVEVTPEIIRKLATKKFKWNHSGVEDLGVIAQDFQNHEVLSLVLRGNDEEGLQVNPLGIAALAIGAAKTLQKQLDESNATIASLIERIEKLENNKL